MGTFTNDSIFTREGKLDVEIYKMQVMTIGMSKLIVGDEKSPIRCDVVLHQEDGHFDDYCFIYHMSHDIKDTVKYNEEIERVKRMMDSNAKFNVYVNPVEFIENCARCLENAPTNRYTKTAFSGTDVESMRYFVQHVADSDENFISEAHAMVARFMDNLKGVVFLQGIALRLGFKIPDVTAYQRDLLVGDRFRDFMAGLKGYIFKGSQDEAREKVRELTPVFGNAKAFPFSSVNEEESAIKIPEYYAICIRPDKIVEVNKMINKSIISSKEYVIHKFIDSILYGKTEASFVINRQSMISIVSFYLENYTSIEDNTQIEDYDKFINWMKRVNIVGRDCKCVESCEDIIKTYTKTKDTALIITKRGEALKSEYKYDYRHVEYAVDDNFNVPTLVETLKKEGARVIYIDSNLGSNIKDRLQELVTYLKEETKRTRGFTMPNVNVETTAGFWLNVCGPMYLM